MAVPKNFDQKSEQGTQIGMKFHFKNKNYEVSELIADGESSEIYLVHSLPKTAKSSQFVIKKYKNDYFEGKGTDEDCKHAWVHEALMVIIQEESPEKSLQLLDKFEINSFNPPEYYLFLNWVDGLSLEDWYMPRYRNNDEINADLKVLLKKIALPIARHLSFLHDQWIIYLNLLVKNITIFSEDSNNDNIYPILIDWSNSKELNPSIFNKPQEISINASFKDNFKQFLDRNQLPIPPEEIAGEKPNALSDVYMFGCILFYLLTGKSDCFQGTLEDISKSDFVFEPKKHNSGIPRDLNQLVMDLTHFKPSRRIKSLPEVIKKIDKIANSIELAKKEIKSKRKIEATSEKSVLLKENVQSKQSQEEIADKHPSVSANTSSSGKKNWTTSIGYISNEDQDFYASYSVESNKNSSKINPSWPPSIDLSAKKPEKARDTSKISCTFTILNNNLEYVIFAENRNITLWDLIHDGRGYVPDYIYSHLLNQFELKTNIFEIGFNAENETFTVKSIFDLTISDMTNGSRAKFEPYLLSAGNYGDLPEEIVISLQTGGFWRIRVWVY